VEPSSPFLLIKQLELQVSATLSALDIYSLPTEERKVVKFLKAGLIDARLDIRDYELSETRAEQLRYAKQAKKRLDYVRKQILLASEYDIFGAVDVAQLTAQIETTSERLI
jgi:hypothetical protein